MLRNQISILALGLLLVILFGCTAAKQAVSPVPTTPVISTHRGQLTPYRSPTASVTPSPTDPATPTPLPSPTPTPRTHVVIKGEDMFGIALRYRVTLEDLIAANPTVSPQFLSIGTVLTIPASSVPEPSVEPQLDSVTLTPIPVQVGSLKCSPAEDGGLWCFAPVYNSHEYPLENLTAAIRLVNADTLEPLEKTAFLPLDILPAGAALPLVAYFPPPRPDRFQASAELIAALPQPGSDGRYLAVRIANQQIAIAEDGRSAEINLEVWLDQDETQASIVRVAAVAYDAAGNVVGVRRWEMNSASPLVSGQALPVVMQVYSVSGPIERVELFAEARP